MASESMRVTFRGVGVDEGIIDARQLGHALVNLADVVSATHTAIKQPGVPAPTVSIKETGQGSFWIELVVFAQTGPAQAAIDALNGRYAIAAVNLGALVQLVVTSIAAVKYRKGRKPRQVSENTERDMVTVTYTDGTTVEYPPAVWLVMQDNNFQKAARATVKPVLTEGISEMEIEARDVGTNESVTVHKEEFKDFEVFDQERPESLVSMDEIYVGPVTVDFTAGKKWRLNDGARDFSASIEDEEFIRKVDDGSVSINALDQFKVLMKTEQILQPKGRPKTEFTILQVLLHHRAGHAGTQSTIEDL